MTRSTSPFHLHFQLARTLFFGDDKMTTGGRSLLTHFIPLTILLGLLLPIDPIGCSYSPGSGGGDDDGASPPDNLCRTCKEDDSSCRVVAGIFTRPQLNVGYNVIAIIPRGACNLNITEIRLSPNHLSLRRPDNSYIFNGDWRLSPSGSYQASLDNPPGGPVLNYKRQDLTSLETITSQGGPLQEALELVVLYQQPNPGIRYEYMLPSSPHSRPQALATTARTSSYVPSPEVLQQLPQPILKLYNTVATFPARSNPMLEPGNDHHRHLHNLHHPRVPHQHRMNTIGTIDDLDIKSISPPPEKTFQWKTVSYTNCSELCGGGIQRSILRCVRSPSGIPVPDRRCSQESKPPLQLLRCNLKPCPAEWIAGNWLECRGNCGLGERIRAFHCQQRISPSLTMRVAEGACLKEKPEERETCDLGRSCNKWESSEWGECSTKCGNGIRRRRVTCVGMKDEGVMEENGCEEAERPAEIKACNMGHCEEGLVTWLVSEWGEECSQGCGGGIQQRHVVCLGLHKNNQSDPESSSNGRRDGEYYSYQHWRKNETGVETTFLVQMEDEGPALVVADGGTEEPNQESVCDASQKPPDERECFSERDCAQPVWLTGEWGECSASCGGGVRTRQVLCVTYVRGRFKIMTSQAKNGDNGFGHHYCPRDNKPADKEPCRTSEDEPSSCSQPRWFTSEWGECSVECGGGIQKRSVSCRAGNWRETSSLCEDDGRPIDKRSCNEFKCASQFLASHQTPPSPNEIHIKDQPKEDFFPRISVKSSDNPPVAHHHHHHHHQQQNHTAPVILPDTDLDLHLDHVEDCPDEYRNCALVVQARLCRYKYYRSVCCHSCSEAPL